MLDLAHNPPSGAHAVRANLVGWDVSRKGFSVGLETWDGGVLYAAEASWIEHKSGARECHFGQFDSLDVTPEQAKKEGVQEEKKTPPPPKERLGVPKRPLLARSFSSSKALDLPPPAAGAGGPLQSVKATAATQAYSKPIGFPVIFRAPPTVICWLNRLDLPSGGRFRIRATCKSITETRATVRIGTWGSGKINGGGMCWIAFPGDKKDVESGTFGVGKWDESEDGDDTDESKEADLDKLTARDGRKVRGVKGRVKFKKGWFQREPTVLVAFNMLDMGGNADLRIRTVVENVTVNGFSWRIETWVRLFLIDSHWQLANIVSG
jgi:hypothetical protein